MKSDADVKTDVENELQWEPDLGSAGVAVSVKDGVVTLTGFVDSFNEKWEVEQAVKRVAGVLGVANDLEVSLPAVSQRSDPEIATDAVNALLYELADHADNIRVVVKDGLARLEGEVESHLDRKRAARAVRRVRGVKGVINTIKASSRTAPQEIKRKIAEALKRSAQLDAANIAVEANGNEVVLKGTVRSWAECKEAEEAAWRVPGIAKVDNRITIVS